MTILTGLFRVTRDAELRRLPSGEAVINLSLVYNYGTKRQGEQYRPSQFLEASIWGKRAEALAAYLRKGTKLDAAIEDLHVEMHDRTNGGTSTKLVGKVLALEFAGNAEDNDERPPAPAPAPRAAAPRPPAPAPRPAPARTASGTGFDDMDDDIPF